MGAMRFKEHALALKEYPDLLTVDEMSKALGVSIKTGYQLLRENKIEHLKVGRAYKVPKAHLLSSLRLVLRNAEN
ncbi:MAG: helix-turn-helix domain-containing protein [Firmicutes bacterium]|nr:helix-turn-helix domain-containing protein [Bacillota bacterium]